MKYVVMSHPEPTARSRDEIIAEHIRPLVEAGDFTSAYIRSLQKREELEAEGEEEDWDQPFSGLDIPPARPRRFYGMRRL